MIHILLEDCSLRVSMNEVTCSVDNSIAVDSIFDELIFVVTLVNVILWKGINALLASMGEEKINWLNR